MDKSGIYVPATADQVTADWLTLILGYDVQPESVSITRNAHEGKGYLSNLLRVHCHDKGKSTESSLIVKLIPEDPFMRDVVVGQAFDKTEIEAYSTILPALVTQLPELAEYMCPFVFGKWTESESDYRSVVVLQDLKPLHYSTFDFGETLSPKQLSAGIDFLAKLHFAGALVEDLNGQPLSATFPLLQHDIGTKPEIFQTWISKYYPEVLEMLQKSSMAGNVKAAYSGLGEVLNDVMVDVFSRLGDCPSLIHADLWTNNILYNQDSSRTKVIDWQVMMYRDVTLDLGVFIMSSLPFERMTLAGVESLVREYYDKFQAYCDLRKKPRLQRRSWEEFYQFFKTYGLAFPLVWFILSQVALEGKNNPRLIRTYEYFYDVGVISFVKSIKKR